MFCKACDYDLRSAPEHRCPECGEAFDPLDPQLRFAGHRKRVRKLRTVTLVAWLLVAYTWFFALAQLLAWIPQELRDSDGAGPWNHPGLVGSFFRLPWWLGFMTLCFAWLPLVLFALGTWLLQMDNAPHFRALRLRWFLLSLAASLSVLFYFTPPGRVVIGWWFD